MRHLAFCLLWLLLSPLAYAQPAALVGEEGRIQLVSDEHVILQENQAFLSRLVEVHDRPGGGVVVTSSTGPEGGESAVVVVYDAEGRQVRTLGQPGPGPFEFQRPYLVSAQEERVLVWDQAQRKLMAFGADGTPLEEWTEFTYLHDFDVLDGHLVTYENWNSEDGFLRIYDPEREAYTCRQGTMTEADYLLLRSQPAGGLAVRGQEVLYATPARQRLYRLDPETCEETAVSFDVPGFSVEEPGDFSPNSAEALEYMFASSRISGIYPAGDYVVVQAETHRMEEGETLLLVLDENFEHRDTIRLPREVQEPISSQVELTDGHRLGFLTQAEESGEVQRRLNWWRLVPAE